MGGVPVRSSIEQRRPRGHDSGPSPQNELMFPTIVFSPFHRQRKHRVDDLICSGVLAVICLCFVRACALMCACTFVRMRLFQMFPKPPENHLVPASVSATLQFEMEQP